jgi:hypothetical protein
MKLTRPERTMNKKPVSQMNPAERAVARRLHPGAALEAMAPVIYAKRAAAASRGETPAAEKPNPPANQSKGNAFDQMAARVYAARGAAHAA